MKWLARIADKIAQRGAVDQAHPRDPVLASWFSGGMSAAGVPVTADTAMRVMAVQSCVRILSDSLGSLPYVLYQRDGESKARAVNDPLYELLHSRPNRWQTSLEWREMLQGHLSLRGNAYSLKRYNNGGQLVELVPLHPDRTWPYRMPDGRVAYKHIDDNGRPHAYDQYEIHHIRGFTLDGLGGLDPISYAQESLGLAVAAEEFGARFFRNGASLSGALQHPGQLGDKAFDHLKETFRGEHQGLANAHKPVILEEGMQWQSLGVEPDKAQFLETRKFQLEEIARMYRIPLHMLGHTEKSTSWGTGIEQFNIGFVVHTLRPWFVRWEQAAARDLISDPATQYVEFLAEGLLRGNTKDRYAAYAVGRQWGWLSANDIRQLENMDTIEGGDVYLSPLNMVPADSDGQDDDSATPRQLLPVVQGAANRIASCERKALAYALQQSGDDARQFESRAVSFVRKHGDFLKRHLEPVWQAAGRDEADLDKACNRHVMSLTRDINATLVHGLSAVNDYIADISAAEHADALVNLLEIPHGN